MKNEHEKLSLQLLVSAWNERQEVSDKTVTECAGVRNAVDIGTFWAKVEVREIIEHDKSKEEEHQNEWDGNREKTQFL